jgi:neutral ceramidase
VRLENAPVLDELCLRRTQRRMKELLLQPDTIHAPLQRIRYHLRHCFLPSEDVDDVDLQFRRNICEGSITSLTQHLRLFRIDRNDAIALCLHVLRNAMRGAERIGRKPHNGDGSGGGENAGLVHGTSLTRCDITTAMHLTRRRGLQLMLASPLALSQTAASSAGFGEADITPDIGMEQPGNYFKSFHKTVHDPCKARVAVVGQGTERVAIVSLDALMVPRQVVLAARAAIAEKTGIAAVNVLVAASHSHSAGPVGMVQPGEYDHADELTRRLAYEESTAANPVYLQHLQNVIISAVVEADRRRGPLRMSFGVGQEDQVAFNRRFRMKNGRTWTFVQQGNADIVEAAGPTDPNVTVMGAWDDQGELIGCLVNFACHATTSPGGISASWIYYMEQVIRGVYGPNVVVLYASGFNGDITQVNGRSKFEIPNGEQQAKIVGRSVGAQAVRVLAQSPTGTNVPLRAAVRELLLQRRRPSPERLAAARKIVQEPRTPANLADWIFGKEAMLLNALCDKSMTVNCEVQAMQVGPLLMLTTEGEMFCEWGWKLRRSITHFPLLAPVSMANGCVGYIPTEEAFSTTGGGYETRISSYTNLEISAGKKMTDELIAMVRDWKPGAMPERPAASPKQPWNYGTAEPQLH